MRRVAGSARGFGCAGPRRRPSVRRSRHRRYHGVAFPALLPRACLPPPPREPSRAESASRVRPSHVTSAHPTVAHRATAGARGTQGRAPRAAISSLGMRCARSGLASREADRRRTQRQPSAHRPWPLPLNPHQPRLSPNAFLPTSPHFAPSIPPPSPRFCSAYAAAARAATRFSRAPSHACPPRHVPAPQDTFSL